MEKNKLILIGALIVVIAIAGTTTNWFGLLKPQTTTIPTIQFSNGDLPPLGNENAPITIVEYSDYQCPFCAKFYKNAEVKLKENDINTGKVKMYYRDFPLDKHDKAKIMANAARCANEQGKFWEMHDKLFETQDSWTGLSPISAYTEVEKFAEEIGLEPTTFKSCVSSNKYYAKISEEINAGSNYGMDSTPTIFIVAKQENVDISKIQSIIDANKDYFALAKDTNGNYVIMVVGSQPYGVFENILGAIKN